jgi:DNA-directed RNA polymerase specialized sigma24 family protein
MGYVDARLLTEQVMRYQESGGTECRDEVWMAMLAIARGYLASIGKRDDEDLAMDACIAAVKGLARFRPEKGSVFNYVTMIACNEAKHFEVKRRVRREVVWDFVEGDSPPNVVRPEHHRLRRVVDWRKKAVKALPADDCLIRPRATTGWQFL